MYRKAEALGMVLAEIGIRERFTGSYTQAIRSVLARIIPLATLFALALLVGVLGSAILPPRGVALSLALAGLCWRSCCGGPGKDARAAAGGVEGNPGQAGAAVKLSVGEQASDPCRPRAMNLYAE